MSLWNRSSNRSARRHAAVAGGMLEALEPRQMLAADLGVRWNEGTSEFPDRLVPGDRILAPIEVINNGPVFADGAVTIRFYLSTDQTLDTSADRLLRTYADELLELPVFAGVDDNIGTFTGDLTIPTDLASGSYFLIVRISPNSAIGDFNQSNNTAASEEKFPVGRFGNVDGLTGASTTLIDADGTRVTFAMTGGGSGNVTLAADGFVVTLTGSTTASRISVSANNGGDRKFDFASVSITGTVQQFTAPAGRLKGPLTTTAGFGAMSFGDVVGPRTITVPAGSATPSFALGVVRDLTISSAVGIGSVSAASWTNTGSARGSINAPWLGGITVTGDLGVNLNLSGRAGNVATLGAVDVGGFLRPSAWVVRGIGTTIRAKATTPAWAATFEKRITSITTTLALRGLLTARSIQSINAAQDLAGATILAGAFLGDDAALGGTGNSADTFLNGVIGSLSVARNVTNSTVAAGLDPVDGVIRNGNDRIVSGTQSQLNRVAVGGIVGAGARLIANVYGPITISGSTIDWRVDQRFSLVTSAPTATLQSWNAVGNLLTFNVVITSSSLMRLLGVTSGGLRLTPATPGAPLPAVTLQSVAFVAGSNQAAVRATFAATADISAEDYVVSIVGSAIRDNRGLAVAPLDLITIGA